MKTKLTFQIIKYIAIVFFIYLILIFFKILPSNENNKNNKNNQNNQNNKNETNNIYKLQKLEAVCPLTIFNPNKQSINDLKPTETIPNPDISNSKTQVITQANKIRYCSVEENTNIKSNQHCMLGNVYLDIEKCNNL